MSTTRSQIARRYAKALASLISTEDEFRKVEGDLQGFSHLLKENSSLRRALYHPSLEKLKRVELLGRILETLSLSSSLSGRFLTLLIERGRLEFLEETIGIWRKFVEDRLGLISAEVVTPFPLADKEKERFRKRLEQMTGRQVRLHARIDPGLIGGIRTRIGSKVYDGSILRQLKHMRQTFVGGN